MLDVKWGSGAFMKTLAGARSLAESLVNVAGELGTRAAATVTDMNQPLGRMIGNAVEVMESLDVLRGGGPPDVRRLTLHLGGVCLVNSGLCKEQAEAEQKIAKVLDSGQAMVKFDEMVRFQGGDLEQVVELETKHEVSGVESGFVQGVDTEQLGYAVIDLGGGRRQLGDRLRHGAGLEYLTRVGERVERGQPLFHVWSDSGVSATLREKLLNAIHIGSEQVQRAGVDHSIERACLKRAGASRARHEELVFSVRGIQLTVFFALASDWNR